MNIEEIENQLKFYYNKKNNYDYRYNDIIEHLEKKLKKLESKI